MPQVDPDLLRQRSKSLADKLEKALGKSNEEACQICFENKPDS